MRILSIGAGLGRGGTERAVETFSVEYQRLGHEVAVLAWQEGGLRQATLERAGIEVFVGGKNLGRALAAADAFRPDLLHIHRVGVALEAETALLRRLRRRDRRVIETNVFGRLDRSDAADYIDVHMLLSRWCLWRWHRWGRDRRRPSIGVVVPNPVDVHRFTPVAVDRRLAFRERLGIPQDAFVCGRVGQASPVKWHRSMFHAFTDLAQEDPNAYLVVVGLPPSFEGYIRALPTSVRRRVRNLPLVDSDDALSELYSSLDCFLHAAAVGESFGYVLAEAMLCECPVVCASTPHVDNSQPEVVGHLIGGVVTASIRDLARGLRQFRRDSALRERVRRGLRDHVVSRFDATSVTALAARVGQLALDCDSRADLQRRIELTDGCVTRVADAEIHRLMHDTLGQPRRKDLIEMRLRHRPLVQRLIDGRLSCRLNHDTAAFVYADASGSDTTAVGTTERRGSLDTRAEPVVVSAIMSAYNTGRYIAAAIDSILAQTMTNWELIVVDDGSTDDTRAVVARYHDPRLTVIACDQNRGRSTARNLGLACARGRYIAICDSDDLSVPTRFAQQVAFLDAHPDIDIVSGQLSHFTEGHAPRVVVRFPLSSKEITQRLARGRMGLAHGASMLRAECFRRTGGYCADVPCAEDLELFCRMARHYTFASLPDVLVAYRHSLPDPFAEWMSAARHQRYARYRWKIPETRCLRPLTYGEFTRKWDVFVLNHTVDLARFTLWSLRSRVAQRGVM
jgi:glycosyltransferase involved in cell wall biosynthesis